jgi:hypothetical protein
MFASEWDLLGFIQIVVKRLKKLRAENMKKAPHANPGGHSVN